MNLRWLLGNFTDPDFLLTPQQQRQVTWLAHRKFVPPRRMAVWTILMLVGSCFLVGVTHKFVASLLASVKFPFPRAAGFSIMAIVVVVLTAWGYGWLYVKPVRMAMRELGHDICITCGYRLQGLGVHIAACPECGEPRPTSEKANP